MVNWYVVKHDFRTTGGLLHSGRESPWSSIELEHY